MNVKQTLSVPAIKPFVDQISLADIATALERRKAGLLVVDQRIPRSPVIRRKNESDESYNQRESARLAKLEAAGIKDAEALQKVGFGAASQEAMASRIEFQHVQLVKVGKVALKANSRAALALRALSAPIVAEG